MSTLNPILSQYSTAAAQAASASSSSSEMSGTDFMELLLAQLTNQNPLEPMSDADMMNQYAQLTSVEELQSMNAMITQSTVVSQTAYAASLIGKNVEVATGTDTSISGLVTGVSVVNGALSVHIGDSVYPLANVTEIHRAE